MRLSAWITCSIQTIVVPRACTARRIVEQRVALGVGQAAGDLVEQQQPGLARERLGELEPLEIEQRQRAGRRAACAAEARQRRAPPAPRGARRAIDSPPPCTAATSTFSNTLICAKGFGIW